MKPTLHEYESISVPIEQRRAFTSLLFVWLAFQVNTVMFFLGATALGHLSLATAFLIVIIGATIISIVASLVGAIGARTGLTTSLLCRHAFGDRGGIVQQVFQTFIELGWYAVTIGITMLATASLLGINHGSVGVLLSIAILLSALSVLTVLFGFDGMKILSYVCIPPLIIVLSYAAIRFIHNAGGLSTLWTPTPMGPPLGVSLTIVVGTFITGATLSSDITRFAKTQLQGGLSGGLSFLVTLPFTLMLGAIVAMGSNGDPDIIKALSSWGFIPLALVILILANWSTADTTLYLAVVPLSKLTGWPRYGIVILLGFVGALLAAFGVWNVLQKWLLFLGVVLPPLAGPIIALGWLQWRTGNLPDINEWNWRGLLSWAMGIASGIIGNILNIPLSPVFSILISFLLFTILSTKAYERRAQLLRNS